MGEATGRRSALFTYAGFDIIVCRTALQKSKRAGAMSDVLSPAQPSPDQDRLVQKVLWRFPYPAREQCHHTTPAAGYHRRVQYE